MAQKLAQAPAPALTQKQINRRAAKAEKRTNRAAKTSPTQTGGKEPLAKQESLGWARDVLSGNIEERNPALARLMREEDLDPTKNPLVQNVANDIQGRVRSDWLGDLDALTQASEAGGRFGGSTWQGARERSVGAANEAANAGLNQLLAGAYEAERNRQAGLAQGLSGTQAQAASIPVSWAANDTARAGVNAQRSVGMANVGVARGHLELAQQQAEFDALQDLINLYGSVGDWGGTQQGGGQYIPTTNPYVSGAAGALGGWLQAN